MDVRRSNPAAPPRVESARRAPSRGGLTTSYGGAPSSPPPPRVSRFAAVQKALPRNTRRATLAAMVGHRDRAVAALDVTPTPAPIEVATRSSDEAPPSSRRARSAWRRFFLVGLAVCLIALSLGHRALEGRLSLDGARDFVAMAERATTDGHSLGDASLLESLVFGKKPAEPQGPPVEEEPQAGSAVKLRRERHVSIPGGILVLPESFQPQEDGTYDLLIHFHGNTAVVRESADVANLNAAVAIINLGIGSQPYEEYYSVGGTYEELLDAVDQGVKQRGLKNATLGRVALSAWSAGYGAISSILVSRRGREHLDAILIFDGIHGSLDEGRLNALQMKPFTTVAQRAAKGEMYFGMTHSAIDPRAYAGTTMTADYLINAVGAERHPLDSVKDAPGYLQLASMEGAVSKLRAKTMEPTSEATLGTFHVTGYRGEEKEHHMAHLFQMGATLLPELVARWSVGR